MVIKIVVFSIEKGLLTCISIGNAVYYTEKDFEMELLEPASF